MPRVSSWEVISGTDSDRVILGVDFPAAGRDEAGLAELAAGIGKGYRFLQTIAPRVSPDQRVTGDAYIEPWIQQARQAQWQVAAVIGYCVGSMYAAPIADRIAEWQQPGPKVILLDPLPADVRLLSLEMHKIIARLAPLLSAEEVADAKQETERLVEADQRDIAGRAIALMDLYRELGSVVFGRLGLNEARREEMIQLFASYLSWIAGAATIDPTAAWNRGTAIISAEYVKKTLQSVDGDVKDDLVGNTMIFDVAHRDLLRSDCTIKAVRYQLEAP
jgi:hypothetical protein